MPDKGILFALLLAAAVPARAVEVSVLATNSSTEEDVWKRKPVYTYASLGFPSEFSRNFLQTMLQSFFDQYRGRAFRRIGDGRDFNHGHFVRDRLAVKAVLLHTQEQAPKVPADSPFSYLDPEGRNWFVSLDRPTEFVNAASLRYSDRPAHWPREWERHTTWYDYIRKYNTTTVMMLDPEKTGIEAVPFLDSEKGEQFNFELTECPLIPDAKLARSNVIPLAADGGRVCLYVSDFKCMFPVHFQCGGVPLK